MIVEDKKKTFLILYKNYLQASVGKSKENIRNYNSFEYKQSNYIKIGDIRNKSFQWTPMYII
jgi:hypothetical protein